MREKIAGATSKLEEKISANGEWTLIVHFKMSVPVVKSATITAIDKDDRSVDPWTVVAHADTGIDYDKLIRMSSYFLSSFIVCISFIHLRSFCFNKNLTWIDRTWLNRSSKNLFTISFDEAFSSHTGECANDSLQKYCINFIEILNRFWRHMNRRNRSMSTPVVDHHPEAMHLGHLIPFIMTK